MLFFTHYISLNSFYLLFKQITLNLNKSKRPVDQLNNTPTPIATKSRARIFSPPPTPEYDNHLRQPSFTPTVPTPSCPVLSAPYDDHLRQPSFTPTVPTPSSPVLSSPTQSPPPTPPSPPPPSPTPNDDIDMNPPSPTPDVDIDMNDEDFERDMKIRMFHSDLVVHTEETFIKFCSSCFGIINNKYLPNNDHDDHIQNDILNLTLINKIRNDSNSITTTYATTTSFSNP